MEKTNAIRLLDSKKIIYTSYTYDASLCDGQEIAKALSQDANRVFKTLVCIDSSHQYRVFMVPVNEQLNLKKAAKLLKVKYVEMIPQKQLLPLTGYVHGGCSPLGMKKTFFTIIHESAKDFPTIFFSGGKRGLQIEMNPIQLKNEIHAEFLNIIG